MTENEKLLLNLDKYGLPCRLEANGVLEGGDSGHNAFTLLYINPLALPRHTVLQHLTSPDGWPRRSPDESKWYGRPKRCSRDLLTPALIFTAVYAHQRFMQYFWACSKHLWCFSNNVKPNFRYDTPSEHAALSTPDVPFEPQWKLPDLLGPDVWSIFIRGLMLQKSWAMILWPLLLILDLQGLLAALLFAYKPALDARNLTLKLHFAAFHYRTPVSALTWFIYGLCQPWKQHTAFWTQPGEPRIDLHINRLF